MHYRSVSTKCENNVSFSFQKDEMCILDSNVKIYQYGIDNIGYKKHTNYNRAKKSGILREYVQNAFSIMLR